MTRLSLEQVAFQRMNEPMISLLTPTQIQHEQTNCKRDVCLFSLMIYLWIFRGCHLHQDYFLRAGKCTDRFLVHYLGMDSKDTSLSHITSLTLNLKSCLSPFSSGRLPVYDLIRRIKSLLFLFPVFNNRYAWNEGSLFALSGK